MPEVEHTRRGVLDGDSGDVEAQVLDRRLVLDGGERAGAVQVPLQPLVVVGMPAAQPAMHDLEVGEEPGKR